VSARTLHLGIHPISTVLVDVSSQRQRMRWDQCTNQQLDFILANNMLIYIWNIKHICRQSASQMGSLRQLHHTTKEINFDCVLLSDGWTQDYYIPLAKQIGPPVRRTMMLQKPPYHKQIVAPRSKSGQCMSTF